MMLPARGVGHRARAERGSALLATLWFAAMLSLVAGQLAYLVSTHTRITGSQIATARAMYLADAGLAYGLALLDAGSEPTDVPLRADFSLGGETVTLRIDNESGKVDLNTAPAAQVQAALIAAGIPADRSSALRDALMDWIDADDLSRADGSSEAASYAASGLAYAPANAWFELIETVRLVPGFADVDLARLAEVATIHRPNLATDPAAMPAPLRAAIGDSLDGGSPPRALLTDVVSVHVGLRDGNTRRSGFFRRVGQGFELIATEAI